MSKFHTSVKSVIETKYGSVTAQNLTYTEAIALDRPGCNVTREAWPTWFYLVDLQPKPHEFRAHPEHYNKPLTDADRAAADWLVIERGPVSGT